jgi:uncharacterized protein (TIGR02246 family)
MRLTVLLFAVLSVSGAAAQNLNPASEDAAVREVVRRYVAAREERDPRAVEALFTEDADQFTTGGEWRRGRPAIVKGTAASSAQNPGRRDIAVEAVRFPAPGVALVDGRYEIAGSANAGRRMWTTLLLTRAAGGWRIAAIRNMVPTSPAPSGGR